MVQPLTSVKLQGVAQAAGRRRPQSFWASSFSASVLDVTWVNHLWQSSTLVEFPSHLHHNLQATRVLLMSLHKPKIALPFVLLSDFSWFFSMAPKSRIAESQAWPCFVHWVHSTSVIPLCYECQKSVWEDLLLWRLQLHCWALQPACARNSWIQ